MKILVALALLLDPAVQPGVRDAAAAFYGSETASSCRRLVDVEVLSVSREGESTVATVAATFAAGDRVTRRHDRLRLAPSAGAAWEIVERAGLEAELARRIAAAATDEERTRLLDDAPSLRGAALAIELTEAAREALESKRDVVADGLQRMAGSIASEANDLSALSAVMRVGSEVARRRPSNDPFEAPALAEESLRLARSSGDPDAIARALLQGYLSGSGADPVDRVLASMDRIDDPATVSGDARQAAHRYMRTDRYVDSLRHGLLALSLANRSGDRNAEVAALYELGLTYFVQREFDLARLYHGRGAEVARAAGLTTMLARHLHGIARSHQQAGDVPASFRTIAEAEAAAASAPDAIRLGIRLTKGNLLIRLSDYASAEAVLCGTVDEARRTGDRDVLSRAFQMSLYLARRQGRYSDFFAMLPAAEVERSQDGPTFADLEASVYWAMGLFDLAAHRYRLVIDSYEVALNMVGDGFDSKAKVAAWAAPAYLNVAELLILSKKPEESLLTAERIKARTLRGTILSGNPGWQRAMSPAERAEESALTRRVHDLKQQALTTAVSEELTSARLRLTEFQSRMAVRYPEPDVAEVEPPRSLDDLAPKEAGVTVVEYVVRNGRTIVFTITKDGERPEVSAHIIPIKVQELRARVERLLQATTNRDFRSFEEARDLYRLLLQPIEPILQRSRLVCIVPDGVLWRVPFHALESDDARPLIDRVPVVYAPSAALLKMTMERRAPGATDAAGEFLGVANAGDTRPSGIRSLLRSALGLGALPDAEREVRQVRDLYGGESRVLLGRDASESNLKRQASGYRVVHIAAHGLADESSPFVSGLLLGRDPAERSGEDGVLDAREILRMGLNARLTVLAACDSGGGRVTAGEGMMGLSWAVLATGCPTTVVSQRQAESKATAKLMIEFHRRLRAGDSPAIALQSAQRMLRRDPRTAHPFYWAAFVVVGAP